MNHPTREEWMDYLYGETSRKTRKRMSSHLRVCETCRSDVAEWRGAMSELDGWRLPDKRSVVPRPRGALRWAAAAMLLLFAGYGLGLLLRPGATGVAELREEIETSLRASLESSIREDLRREFDESLHAALADARTRMRDDLVSATQYAMNVSNATIEGLFADFVQSSEAVRAVERSAVLGYLREMESRRMEDFWLLQNDVATLAVLTDNELMRTNGDIEQLARWAGSAAPVSNEMPDGNLFEERREK